jgi:hypothetical protein
MDGADTSGVMDLIVKMECMEWWIPDYDSDKCYIYACSYVNNVFGIPWDVMIIILLNKWDGPLCQDIIFDDQCREYLKGVRNSPMIPFFTHSTDSEHTFPASLSFPHLLCTWWCDDVLMSLFLQLSMALRR